MATPVTVSSEQTLEATVAGPAGATRLIVVAGQATCNVSVSVPSPGGGGAVQQGSFEAHVGPALTVAQFRRAVATASIASLSASGSVTAHNWAVTAVSADYDDDAGRVQLEFDIQVAVQGSPMAGATQVLLATVAFQVTILAA
jgi:hypothetical protein